MRTHETDTTKPVSGREIQLVTGGAGHQLNTMLQAIIGHAELIAGHGVDGPERVAAARTIRRIALNASRILEKLTALSRTGRTPVRLELFEHVCAVVEELRSGLPAGVELELRGSAERCPVRLEEASLRLLLEQLVTNARDAMPRGGRITVSARRDGARAVLEVSDTGEGLDPEVRARFFEPFFTTRPGSAGLGLTMVHEIVQEAGGEIVVTSELGHGTTVHVQLPLATLPPFRARDHASSPAHEAGAPHGHGEKVLLADDDEGGGRATR